MSCILLLSISLLFIVEVVAMGQPTCNEDAQCSTGFYCNISTHSCKRCISCVDYGRVPALPADCIKYLVQCESCFKGSVKVFEDLVAARCKAQEIQRYSHLLLWSCAMVVTILVVGTFLHVLHSTSVYRIVAYTFAQNETRIAHCVMDIEAPLVLPQKVSSDLFDQTSTHKRMSVSSFEELLHRITPHIAGKYGRGRPPIEPLEMLGLTVSSTGMGDSHAA